MGLEKEDVCKQISNSELILIKIKVIIQGRSSHCSRKDYHINIEVKMQI